MTAPGLFEPTEGRGPAAPPGVPFVWGVDVSSLRVSIAVESDLHYDEEHGGSGTTRAVFTKSFTRGPVDLGQRMKFVFEETLEIAVQLRQRYPPEQIAVEQPAAFGRNVEPVLWCSVGAVATALAGLDVPVWMMPIARWKARAVGKGNASKAEALQWAHAEGFGARIEDEADAAGVCRAARLTVWEGLCDAKDIKRGAVPR